MKSTNLTAVLGLSLALFCANHASAITLAGDGTVLDGWNVKPFAGGASPSVLTHHGMTSYYQNNWSPVSYPGVGHLPSPGGATGEKFDLEEMHIRQSGATIEMLLVASSLFSATASGSTLYLGDILLDFTGDGLFDAGLVTQSATHGLVAGGLYDNLTLDRLQNVAGSYRGTATESQIGKWGVSAGTFLGSSAVTTATYNYGGSEGTTALYSFTFDLTPLAGVAVSQMDFHLTWGCGNDVINGSFDLAPTHQGTDPQPLPVPEPVTATLGFVGLSALALAVTRRRSGHAV